MRITFGHLAAVTALLLLSAGCSSSSSPEAEQDVSTCGCEADAACTAVTPECAEPVPCTGNAECEDGNPCTAGECFEGFCQYGFVGGDGCCSTSEECADDNMCTTSACVQGQCVHTWPDPLCCTAVFDCDDGNVCTKDSCVDSQCGHEALPDCCTDNLQCNDGKTCTADLCIYGVCVHPTDSSVAGCDCSSTADCEDLNACTLDKCLNYKCQYDLYFAAGQPVTGCCKDDYDCSDEDPTTVDVCIQFMCVNYYESVCKFDSECDDGDDCTLDQCHHGHCVVEGNEIKGCCQNDAQCEDSNDCTVDKCQDNLCAYTGNVGQAGCCQGNDECNDNIDCTKDVCVSFRCDWLPQSDGCCHDAGDCPPATLPCTKAFCNNGQCGIENATNCCEQNIDCDDGNPCTDDKCEAKQCFHWDIAKCCAGDADCNDDNVCTDDKCVGGKCQEPKQKPGCCVNQGQCNDSDICTIDQCVNNQCLYTDKEECCHKDSECIPEISCMIPHCVNGNCLFDLGPGCCQTDADCNDKDNVCTTDTCVGNKCQYALIPNEEVECCLTATDCLQGNACLATTCTKEHQCLYTEKPDCCLTDDECDDGDDLCTDDLCTNNACIYSLTGEKNCCLKPADCTVSDVCMAPTCSADHLCGETAIANCCHNDGECNDGDDLCTSDTCVDNWCVFTPTGAEGCCEKDADCVNPDLCLKGKCNVQTTTCSYSPIPGCCHFDADCDDGDDVCTADSCVNNKCVNQNTGAPGCCEEFTWSRNFDDGTDGGFTFNNSMGLGLPIPIPGFDFSLGWNVSGDCGFVSNPAALYYGMAEGLLGEGCTYAIDLGGLPFPIPMENKGTATSATFTLPADQSYTLKLQLVADVASANNADSFKIEVMKGTVATEVFNKSALPGATGPNWQSIKVDLSAFAGQTIALRFNFDTLGGPGSGGIGLLIDDLSVTADCNP